MVSTSIAQQVERIARMVDEASGLAEKSAEASSVLENCLRSWKVL